MTSTELPKPLRLYLLASVALCILAFVCEAYCRQRLRLGFPYSGPLLFEHFPDLVTLRPRFRYFHTLQFFTDTSDAFCMYPAPVAVCYRILFAFQPYDLLVLLLLISTAALFVGACFRQALRRAGLLPLHATVFVGIALALSYPLWFELRQANMEIFPWLLVTAAIWCFLSGRYTAAAICFSIAGSLKITPFLYLALFVPRKQYKPIAVGLLAATMVTVVSLWLVYPHVVASWQMTNTMVARFREAQTLRTYPQAGFDHSIFGALKRPALHILSGRSMSKLLSVYSLAALITSLFVCARIRTMPVLNQILALCVMTVVLPPTSFDYTLMNLYLPWALLTLLAVRESRHGKMPPGIPIAMICFAILFAPETEFILRGRTFGGQLKALALVGLLLTALRYHFGEEHDVVERNESTNSAIPRLTGSREIQDTLLAVSANGGSRPETFRGQGTSYATLPR